MKIKKVNKDNYSGWVLILFGWVFYGMRGVPTIGEQGETEKTYVGETPLFHVALLVSIYPKTRLYPLGETNLLVPFHATAEGCSIGKLRFNWLVKKAKRGRKKS